VISRHDRRHSGRRTAKIYHPEIYPYEWDWYDDWNNYRDGMRDLGDRSKIRPSKGICAWYLITMRVIADNLKLKRKERIRKVQRYNNALRVMPRIGLIDE
jgi:hypothetical protein